ncbi:hypothetical protein F5Y04DRAFT_285287 [Hypomontagnella monticulosa]|nr:hypothetical protein F5Y04DRAFT_285287 [Hypomontagnella monticulosa]
MSWPTTPFWRFRRRVQISVRERLLTDFLRLQFKQRRRPRAPGFIAMVIAIAIAVREHGHSSIMADAAKVIGGESEDWR